MDCNDTVVLQYTINCGGSSLVDLDMNCDSSTCSYERSTSSGCPLSVTARNAVGMSTSNTSSIQDSKCMVRMYILKCAVLDHLYFSNFQQLH